MDARGSCAEPAAYETHAAHPHAMPNTAALKARAEGGFPRSGAPGSPSAPGTAPARAATRSSRIPAVEGRRANAKMPPEIAESRQTAVPTGSAKATAPATEFMALPRRFYRLRGAGRSGGALERAPAQDRTRRMRGSSLHGGCGGRRCRRSVPARRPDRYDEAVLGHREARNDVVPTDRPSKRAARAGGPRARTAEFYAHDPSLLPVRPLLPSGHCQRSRAPAVLNEC